MGPDRVFAFFVRIRRFVPFPAGGCVRIEDIPLIPCRNGETETFHAGRRSSSSFTRILLWQAGQSYLALLLGTRMSPPQLQWAIPANRWTRGQNRARIHRPACSPGRSRNIVSANSARMSRILCNLLSFIAPKISVTGVDEFSAGYLPNALAPAGL